MGQAGGGALCHSLVGTGILGCCDLIGIPEVEACQAEMGLVRGCVFETRSKFLRRIKKQYLRRLLLLWFEGPRTRCCDSIPCPRARFPGEGS